MRKLKSFRVDIVRTCRYELDVMAVDVAHAEDITNALLDNTDEICSGKFRMSDLEQFIDQNADGKLHFFDDYAQQMGDEVEVEWVHDNFDMDEEEA